MHIPSERVGKKPGCGPLPFCFLVLSREVGSHLILMLEPRRLLPAHPWPSGIPQGQRERIHSGPEMIMNTTLSNTAPPKMRSGVAPRPHAAPYRLPEAGDLTSAHLSPCAPLLPPHRKINDAGELSGVSYLYGAHRSLFSLHCSLMYDKTPNLSNA